MHAVLGSKWSRFAFLAFALAIVVTLFRVKYSNHSLWFDEQASLFFAQQKFSNLWSDWILRETNPPLYYSILKVWIGSTNHSNAFYRFPSIFFGALTVCATYAIASRIFNPHIGIYAAILTALSGQQLYYSEQVRGYELLYLTSVFAIYSVYAIAKDLEQSRISTHVIFVVSATIMIYVHTTAILFPCVAFASVFGSRASDCIKRPAVLVPLVISVVAVYILSFWWVRIAVLQVLHKRENIAMIGVVTWGKVARETLATVFFLFRSGVLSQVVELLIAALAVLMAWRLRTRPGIRALVLLFGLWIFLLGAIGHHVPVFVERTIVWVSIVPLLLVAAAIAELPRPAWQFAFLITLSVPLAFDTLMLVPNLETEQWDQAISKVSETPNPVLLVQGEAMGLLAQTTCNRLLGGMCPFPVVAVTDPGDAADIWANGLFTGSKLPIDHIDSLPRNKDIFLFRKKYYHNLVTLLHEHGKAADIADSSPPLVGPISYQDVVKGR